MRRAARDDEQRARLAERPALAVAEARAAADPVHVEHGRARLGRAAVAEPERGADPRPEARARVTRCAARRARPRPGATRRPWSAQPAAASRPQPAARPRRACRRRERQVEGEALDGERRRGAGPLAQLVGREAVPAHRGQHLEHDPAVDPRRRGSRPGRRAGRRCASTRGRRSAAPVEGRPPGLEHQRCRRRTRPRPRRPRRRCRPRRCRRRASRLRGEPARSPKP